MPLPRIRSRPSWARCWGPWGGGSYAWDRPGFHDIGLDRSKPTINKCEADDRGFSEGRIARMSRALTKSPLLALSGL